MDFAKLNTEKLHALWRDGALDLDNLGNDDLDAIYGIEMEAALADGGHDSSLMNECAQRLLLMRGEDEEIKEFSKDDIKAVGADVLAKADAVERPKRHIKGRRIIAIAAVMAVLIVILGVTAAAQDWSIFDEIAQRYGFSSWSEVIREAVLGNLKGEVFTDDDGKNEIVFGNMLGSYKSFDELEDDVGFRIFHPSADHVCNFTELSLYDLVSNYKIYADFTVDDIEVYLRVEYGGDAELYNDFNEKWMSAGVRYFEWNGYSVFYYDHDGDADGKVGYIEAQFVDDGRLYFLIEKSLDDLKFVLSTCE